MAKICYSLSGEGRGHASRVAAIVDMLRRDHEVVVYTFGMALDLLRTRFGDDITVRQIPGLSFRYGPSHRLASGKTLFDAAYFVRHIRGYVGELCRELEREKPDLAITDFEPLLPRAARKCGIPFMSVDHQHFLLAYDLSSLPMHLRLHAKIMSLAVRAFCWGPAETVVSSFFFPPLAGGFAHVQQAGVLLSPRVLRTRPCRQSHLVVYLRRFSPPALIQALKESGVPMRIYGLGEHDRDANLTFFAVDPNRFIDDLAASRGLICTAGNQLIGEAMYLGKPIIGMPEPGNKEQAINAHFLAQSAGGLAVPMRAFGRQHILRILEHPHLLFPEIPGERICGNATVLNAISGCLSSVQNRSLRTKTLVVGEAGTR